MTCGRLEVVSVDELASTTCHHTMAKARNGQIQRSQELRAVWQSQSTITRRMPGPKSFNTNTNMQTSHYHYHHIKISSHPSSIIQLHHINLKAKTHHKTHTHNFWLMSWSAAKLTQLWEYPESIDSSSVLLGGKKLKCN